MRLAILSGVTLGLIVFFILLMTRLQTGEMQTLYGELNATDSAAIAQRLDGMGVPYTVDTSGSQITVPAADVGRVRMTLAAEGLPSGGSVGYEIFDKSAGFGTTAFVQNINQLRALEGELARTIGTLGPIRNARIHLVLPKRELFSRETTDATASVFLQLRPGASLDRQQVLAIQHLIAAAVPQLKPNLVSIVDDSGTLLARGMDDTGALAVQNAEEMRRAYEARLTRTVEDLVARTVGYGKVRATVSADLDFDRVSTNTETFDPDQQVVRSTQTVSEENQNADAAGQSVSVANNLPGGEAEEGAGGPTSSSRGARNEETVNYEIGRTVTNHVREGGQVRRLSIAVLVDGNYTAAEDGTQNYAPRAPEEIEQISALVRSAVGFDSNRGDTLEVVNMRFAQEDTTAIAQAEAANKIFGFDRSQLLHVVETVVLGLVALLVVILVVRPLLTRLFAGVPTAADDMDETERLMLATAPGGAGAAALAGPMGMGGDQALLGGDGGDSDLDRMIDIGQVEGRVRASSIKKVGEIVEKHPNETVSILRGWIYQET
jgi:flagellar M-ring protein FliF